MAPTETLAEQHFATIQSLMPGEHGPGWRCSPARRPPARRATSWASWRRGELALVVGHPRADRGRRRVRPPRGRRGRRAAPLRRAPARRARPQGADGSAPHVLHMTATPIPRTLALTAYGDLDMTVLRELPGGRQPITTHVVAGERERARAYERIREELRAGRQAFVVCPLVEESEALQARAADGRVRAPARATEFARLPRRAPARPDAPAREAGGDGALRRRRRRRARGHVGDRGRDRRPERDRDAGRGRRALRHLPAAPAARAGRPRRARVAVPALRAQGVARACARWPSTATASGSPRSTCACAARASSSGRASRASPSFGLARCPRTRAARARRARRGSLEADPEPRAARARAARRRAARTLRRRGARAHPGVRIVAGRFGGRRLVAPAGPRTRPTSDRVREALFSVLGAVEGAARARPLRRLGRARARGALARRSGGDVRRLRGGRRARHPGEPRGARDRRRGAPCGRARVPPQRKPGRTPHTIWSSSTRHTGWPAGLGRELAPLLAPVLAPGARVVGESDRRAPLELALPLADERRYGDTLIRIHEPDQAQGRPSR